TGTRISSSDDPTGSGQQQNPTNSGGADGTPHHHMSSHDTSDAAYEQAYQTWLSTHSSNPDDDDSDTDSEAGKESGEYPLLPIECFLRRYRLSDGYFSRPPMFFLLDETEEERCVRQSVEQVQAELAYGQFSWWCRFHFGRDPHPIHPISDADKVNLAYRMGKMDRWIREQMSEKYDVDWKRDAQTYDTLTLPQVVDTHMKRKYGFSWPEEPEHSSEDYEPGVIYW
ncbi:hypothetical protein GE09DRAFT_1113156, partial [Coniochaeta sp. 2T2.1]